jgi:hypothetical protein
MEIPKKFYIFFLKISSDQEKKMCIIIESTQ